MELVKRHQGAGEASLWERVEEDYLQIKMWTKKIPPKIWLGRDQAEGIW